VCSFQNGAFVPVGAWDSETGLQITTPIVWPGMNTESDPSQEVPRVLIRLNESLRQSAIALTVRSTPQPSIGSTQSERFLLDLDFAVACLRRAAPYHLH
jgi:hypothetical protein